MKKEAALITILFLFLTSSALAAPGKNNEHSEKSEHAIVIHDQKDDFVSGTATPTETMTPSPTTVTVTLTLTPSDDCDNGEIEHHGQFVSCVARLHLGGKHVSEAAHSSIGKKDHDGNKDHDEDDDHEKPTATPSVSPTVFLTPAPTVPLSITPPITTAEGHLHFTLFPDFGKMWNALTRFFSFGKSKHTG